jgi:hypothetical protein
MKLKNTHSSAQLINKSSESGQPRTAENSLANDEASDSCDQEAVTAVTPRKRPEMPGSGCGPCRDKAHCGLPGCRASREILFREFETEQTEQTGIAFASSSRLAFQREH